MNLKLTRRHLLKGSLAAPLVLTVRSAAGTGTAMQSATACQVRDRDRYAHDKIYKFKPGPNDDEWLRTAVKICRIRKKNGDKKVESGEYFWGNTGCFWQYVKNGSDCDVYEKKDFIDSTHKVDKELRTEYGLVCIDNKGVPKYFAWEKKDYSPITCSCWASLKIT